MYRTTPLMPWWCRLPCGLGLRRPFLPAIVNAERLKGFWTPPTYAREGVKMWACLLILSRVWCRELRHESVDRWENPQLLFRGLVTVLAC